MNAYRKIKPAEVSRKEDSIKGNDYITKVSNCVLQIMKKRNLNTEDAIKVVQTFEVINDEQKLKIIQKIKEWEIEKNKIETER